VKNNGIPSASPASPVASEPAAPPRPDPEVVANAKRRTFNAEYKLGILAEADAARRAACGACCYLGNFLMPSTGCQIEGIHRCKERRSGSSVFNDQPMATRSLECSDFK
jgi:hypothetical protein